VLTGNACFAGGVCRVEQALACSRSAKIRKNNANGQEKTVLGGHQKIKTIVLNL